MSMRCTRWLVVAALHSAAAARGAEFYVAANAGGGGTGSIGNPWQLQTALNHPSAVHPGDTIWVRGGIYTGAFASRLAGSSGSPIIVRNYSNERAILQGNGSVDPVLWADSGGYTWFWGLEVTNPQKMSLTAVHDAMRTYTSGIKWINMIIHDNANGLSISWAATNAEANGCLIYYNGREDVEHGIYPQNINAGTKKIIDNIIFTNAGYGVHAYSSSQAISNILVDGNILYNNGALTDPMHRNREIMIGGENPSDGISIKNNYTWNPAGVNEGIGLQLESGSLYNLTATIQDNYFIANRPFFIKGWQNLTVTGNTIFPTQNNSNPYVELTPQPGVPTSSYNWTNNTYVSGVSGQGEWTLISSDFSTLPTWRTATLMDATSTVVQNAQHRPTGTQIFIRPNVHEAGRAHVAVYNWDQLNSVDVDLASVIPVGASYEIRNAANFFGAPVLAGVYAGGSLTLPMTGLSVATPIGYAAPAPTGPEFNAFVVLTISAPFEFLDVPLSNPMHDYVHTVAANGITAGCGGGYFCPNAAVTRAQMAVFLLKSKHGSSYLPPPATGSVFDDVPSNAFAAGWIEQAAAEGITAGCGGGNYCPGSPVTRAQMAVFLLRASLGSGYVPSPATGTVFADVPSSAFAAAWIEDLAGRGITAGCGNGYYCPGQPSTRGAMAVFLVKTFNLQ